MNLHRDPNPAAADAVALDHLRSVWELRADGWIELSEGLQRLLELAPDSADAARCRERVRGSLAQLRPIEAYRAFPGRRLFDEVAGWFDAGDEARAAAAVRRINAALASRTYRHQRFSLASDEPLPSAIDSEREAAAQIERPYFEVLIVDDLSEADEDALRERVRRKQRSDDDFVFDVVFVPSFEDALIASLFNFNLQACVIRHGVAARSRHRLEALRQAITGLDERLDALPASERAPWLGSCIAALRPELDLYLVTELGAEDIASRAGDVFTRVFLREEEHTELYMAILRGVAERYRTPFFNALREYAKQPTGVFHALPAARGKSILNSNWIQDLTQFYGLNLFMAETSATSGGLDSLLDPVGPLKLAQAYAARAFGAQRTYFATNGTSTANKIVVQALVQPGDIVLVDRNCHKSHHYGMVLAGAQVVYLDSYPLHAYSMYGAVPLGTVKQTLLALREAGRLERVKMVLLTNCTFDGVVYDVERVMAECLAIKPDLVFLWDEAWFAFARCHPTYRHRTAMAAAARLARRLAGAGPGAPRVRVYATQSTHKTLTSLRQGSMIHIWDQDFSDKVEEAFHEAYMTHTSTSPNYQILASLDVGRRQVELEGYELVQRQLATAMALRDRVASHPLLARWFSALDVADIVPPEFRASGVEHYYDDSSGWSGMERAWREDEFVLDPTRVTLAIGATGVDGDTFKNRWLMDRWGIQVNKTSRNTVLLMTNIGTTRSSVAYLIEVLVKIAQEIEASTASRGAAERRLHERRIQSLTVQVPPLPDFSHFHAAFRSTAGGPSPEGDLRRAFFLAYDDANCEYLTLREVRQAIAGGREVVSALFVIPYPPGFPILVPGQVISAEILGFMEELDVREIHGYRPELGLRVFADRALLPSVLPAPPRRTAPAPAAPLLTVSAT